MKSGHLSVAIRFINGPGRTTRSPSLLSALTLSLLGSCDPSPTNSGNRRVCLPTSPPMATLKDVVVPRHVPSDGAV
ncbi:hypothetical protein GW17_00053100 [Ensete ventricosum]|nr:hypothetical protein GW17_00053100 [Ensete ventricosum]